MLDRFATFLDRHTRVLLTTHENPDGDGIGAAVALAAHLKSGGKEARIVVSPALPENLRFLDPEGWIEAFDPTGVHQELGVVAGCLAADRCFRASADGASPAPLCKHRRHSCLS